jgi:HlyD family secretion protein
VRRALLAALAVGVAAACGKTTATPVYQALSVERRNIVVSVQASGAIQPDTTVEVKSKASGEILDLKVETGQVVRAGSLMVLIDPRQPKNTLALAQADLDVARARLANAEAAKRRADELFTSQVITETEHDQSQLDYATAKADAVGAQVAVENARDQLDDTRVRAPITGTIIVKNVERGQVISSPTKDVGGGTVLLKMADLNLVQVRTLVDETDIGKIAPGLSATVVADAYPNHPFDGTVIKIEPQAEIQQNVTMFPVIVRIDNHEGLLRPGMNCEVEVHVGEREDAIAVPNAALRTQKDVASAAQVLGLDHQRVQEQLAAAEPARRDSTGARTSTAASRTKPGAKRTATTIDTSGSRFGGRYIVFAKRGGQIMPVQIRTGLTDLDYTEVTAGLTETDSVLILPSASLVQSQQQARQRMNYITGGGLPGVQNQAKPPAASGVTRP